REPATHLDENLNFAQCRNYDVSIDCHFHWLNILVFLPTIFFLVGNQFPETILVFVPLCVQFLVLKLKELTPLILHNLFHIFFELQIGIISCHLEEVGSDASVDCSSQVRSNSFFFCHNV